MQRNERDLESARAAGPERAPARAWYALAVLVVVTILSAVDNQIFVLLLEPMRKSLALTDTQIGLIRGVGLVLFAGLASMPPGWLSDRYDKRLVLVGCIVLWSAATLLRGWAPDYTILFMASIGLAVGEAGVTPIVLSLIPRLFPGKQRALANGVYVISSLFGAALGSIGGGAMVTLVEARRHSFPLPMQGYEVWRLVFFALGVVGIPVCLLVLSIRSGRGAPAPQRTATAAGDAPLQAVAATPAFGDYLRTHWRTLAGLVVGNGVAAVGSAAIGTWIPILAARKFGATPAAIGQGIGVAAIAGILAGAALGIGLMRFAGRVGSTVLVVRIAIVVYIVIFLLSTALPFVRSATQVFVLLGLLFVPVITLAMIWPNLMQDICAPHLRTRVLTLLHFAGLPFSVIAPLLIGVLSDALKPYPDGLAYAVVAITLLASAMGAVVMWVAEKPLVRLVQAMQRHA